MAMKTIGMIGFGQFGQLAARYLRENFDVAVADSADRRAEAAALRVGWATLHEVATRDVVIVAVPVQAMRAVFTAVAPHVRPGTLIIDVGSVKVLQVRWMEELLPAHAD